jgi:hypothetical protein
MAILDECAKKEFRYGGTESVEESEWYLKKIFR